MKKYNGHHRKAMVTSANGMWLSSNAMAYVSQAIEENEMSMRNGRESGVMPQQYQ